VTLTGVFTNGTGVISPGNLTMTSGIGLTVTPTAPTTYILTVSKSAGTPVTKEAGVTVVPTGAVVLTPNLVQASGAQQTTPGGTFSNGPVVGEPVAAMTAATPSNSLQVRHDFSPSMPLPSN
jgi:hypothetical protein